MLKITSKNKEGVETKGNLTFAGGTGDYEVYAQDDCLNATTASTSGIFKNLVFGNEGMSGSYIVYVNGEEVATSSASSSKNSEKVMSDKLLFVWLCEIGALVMFVGAIAIAKKVGKKNETLQQN